MRYVAFPVVALLVVPGCGDEEPPVQQRAAALPTPSEFMRYRELDPENGLLETAVHTYTDGEGRTVTLVSAVHVADAAHYEALQESFRDYDKVLYELVADPDLRPSPDDPPRGGLSTIQRMMARGFELEFQLDGIDYSAGNFVHADLTPEGFARLQSERQESFVTLFLRAMRAQMAMASESRDGEARDFDLVSAFQAGYGRHTMRMLFATQLESIERMAAGFSGPDGGSVLVEGRNARAMEVLDEQLEKGARRVAIYYGAAHMPDFEQRLLARGFEKTAESWLLAWDVRKRKDGSAPEPR